MHAEPTTKTEILVVDDSKSVRSVMARALGENFTVHLAEDGQQAWSLLQHNNNIAVIYTDMSMPVVNGLALLKMIRTSNNQNIAKTPVIIITGESDNEATKKVVYDMGATDFILKPFDSIELLSKTRSYAELSQKINKLQTNIRHDELTSMYNEDSFNERGQEILALLRGLEKTDEMPACSMSNNTYTGSRKAVNCDLWDAFTNILNYNYSNITINQLNELTIPLRDFTNYLSENRLETSNIKS